MQQEHFAKKVLPYQEKMYRLAKRLLVSHDEAQDAVQEIYYKLWKNKNDVNNYQNPEAYAMIMTKNYCLDRLKSHQAKIISLNNTQEKAQENQITKTIDDKNKLGMVFEIIKTLPETYQIVIQLREVEGYEFKEIASIMETNETNVRVTLSRARKKIKEIMLKSYNDGNSKN